jgi:hypothetical protein
MSEEPPFRPRAVEQDNSKGSEVVNPKLKEAFERIRLVIHDHKVEVLEGDLFADVRRDTDEQLLSRLALVDRSYEGTAYLNALLIETMRRLGVTKF